MKTPIAVAVYSTESGDLYSTPLYNNADVLSVRAGTHPDIAEDERVIIVFPDMTTEEHT